MGEERALLAAALLCLLLSALLSVGGRPAGADDDPVQLNPTKTGVGSVTCTTKDNRTGVCVDYTLCYQNGSIIKYAQPDAFELREGRCPSVLDWCCVDDILTEEEAMEQRKKLEASKIENSTEVSAGFRTNLGCGTVTDGLRAGSSKDMAYGECPWCVAIYRDGGNPSSMSSSGYFCTGSLIHPRVVLTAAACAASARFATLTVRVGDHDLAGARELFPHQERAVSEHVVHEMYNSAKQRNNIALLFLKEPVDIQDNVNTACLPRQGEEPPAGGCLSGGWGRDRAGGYRDVLAKVALTPLESASCTTRLRELGAGAGYSVDGGSFCAQPAPDGDICPANQGSPLFCLAQAGDGRFVQHGVGSWSIRCTQNAPGVYQGLAALRAWVDGQMALRSLDSATYTLP